MGWIEDLAALQAAEDAKYQTGFQDWLMGSVPTQQVINPVLQGLSSTEPAYGIDEAARLAGLQAYTPFSLTPQAVSPEQTASATAANSAVISPYMQSLGFSNPVDWFASVGNNRDALYGAYGTAAPNPSGTVYPWEIENLGTGNRAPIPDLAGYTGQELIFRDQFEDPIAMKSSQEAQAILKQFYPNIPQSQLDQAAYSAIQKQGYMPYWGSGPIPTVQLIAKELGIANPQLDAWAAQNQDAYAQRYQTYRDQVHSAEDADSLSRTLGQIGGLASVLGPAIGGAMGLNLFGPGSTADSMGNLFSNAVNTAATPGATSGGTGMFEGLGDWITNLFGGGDVTGGAVPSTGFNVNDLLGITNTGQMTPIPGIGGLESITGNPAWDAMFGQTIGAGTSLAGAGGGGYLADIIRQATSNPLGTAGQLAKSLGIMGSDGSVNPTAISGLLSSGGTGGLLSGLLSAGGGYLSGQSASDAAEKMAQAQLEAARIAADAAKFKPVGVTTRFGQSQFTKDALGNVTDAGYTTAPDIAAMRESLLGAAPGMLSQFTGSQAATAPMGAGAQRAFSLGNQYLSTDPVAQAQKYYNDQQAIMAAQRARDTSGTLAGEFNRGTYGLATGATGMMGAANPRLEALYNAQRQQDLQAAANATQGGMDYAKFGAGLIGTGGNLLRDMYGTQSASLDPWKAGMGGAQYLEGLGQNALDLSTNLGKVASPAESGRLLGQGMLGAAQAMQPANAYSPWGTALMNAGNALGSMQQQQQQQYMFNPFTGVRL